MNKRSGSYVGLPQSTEEGFEEPRQETWSAAFLLDPAVVFQACVVSWCWISCVLNAKLTYLQLAPVSIGAIAAAWRIYSLKPLQAELSYFKEENTKFRNHNEQLSHVAESLHAKNKDLNRSICDLEHVREALERYAEKTHGDVGAVLAEVKSSIVEQERSIAEQKRIQKKTQAIQRRQRGTLDLLLQSSLMSLKHDGAGGVADKDFNELYAMLPASLSDKLDASDQGGGAAAQTSLGRSLPDMLRETMGRLRELDADEEREDEAELAAGKPHGPLPADGGSPSSPGMGSPNSPGSAWSWPPAPGGPASRQTSRASEGGQDTAAGGTLRRMRSGVHMVGMETLFDPPRSRAPDAQEAEAAPQEVGLQGPFGLLGAYRLPVRSKSSERAGRALEAVGGEQLGVARVSEYPGTVSPASPSAGGCSPQAAVRGCAQRGLEESARNLGDAGDTRLAATPLLRSATGERPATRTVSFDEPPTSRALQRDRLTPLAPMGAVAGAHRGGAAFVSFVEREEYQNDEPPTHRSAASDAPTIYSPQSSGRGLPPLPCGATRRGALGPAAAHPTEEVSEKLSPGSTESGDRRSTQWSPHSSNSADHK